MLQVGSQPGDPTWSNHEWSPSSAHAPFLPQLSVHVFRLSACTKYIFTQILETPLLLETQEPGEFLCRQQWPGSTWFLAQGDGMPWDHEGLALLRHARTAGGSTVAKGVQVAAWDPHAGWTTELGILHLKGQHMAGHLPFTWHKTMHAGPLPLFLPSLRLYIMVSGFF